MKSIFLSAMLLLFAIESNSQTLAYADTIATTSGEFMLETNEEPVEVSYNQQTQVAEDGGYAEQLNFHASSARHAAPISKIESISFTISPNPAHDRVILSLLNGGSDLTLNILDLTGRVVSAQTFYSVDGVYLRPLDLSIYNVGVYIIDIQTGGEHFTRKLVKQ